MSDDPPAGGHVPASVGRRSGAFVIDMAGLVMVMSALTVVLASTGLLPDLVPTEPGAPVSPTATVTLAILSAALMVAYFGLLEATSGQTLAKRLLGIRVVAADGSPPTLTAAVQRRLPIVVAQLVPTLATLATVGVGAAMLITAQQDEPEHRGFHDRWAGTRVVAA